MKAIKYQAKSGCAKWGRNWAKSGGMLRGKIRVGCKIRPRLHNRVFVFNLFWQLQKMLLITSDFLSHYRNLSQFHTFELSAREETDSRVLRGSFVALGMFTCFDNRNRQIGWEASAQHEVPLINANDFRSAIHKLYLNIKIKISNSFSTS